eukprot:551360_1
MCIVPQFDIRKRGTVLLTDIDHKVTNDDMKELSSHDTQNNININHANTNGMFLSFHVKKPGSIQCYLYLQEQMIRFAANDLKTLLPLFFEDSKENKTYINSNELENVIHDIDNILSKDSFFKYFYPRNKIKDELLDQHVKNQLLTPEEIPLHKFTTADICNFIQQFVLNDVDYKKYLAQTKEIFTKNEIHGSRIRTYDTYDIQLMVENELLEFMTPETVKIIFSQFNHWRKEEENDVNLKTAQDIAESIYRFPLDNLIIQLKEEHIDGMKLRNVLKHEHKISNVTGWDQRQMHQIYGSLLKLNSLTEQEFKENMNKVAEEYQSKLSLNILKELKDFIINSCEVESLHFQIKNGKRNEIVQEFSVQLMEKIDYLNQNVDQADIAKTIYNFVAECFIVKDDLREKNWICSNCGASNFKKYIGSKLSCDLSTCILCGLKQKDTIILNLKDYGQG